MKIIDDALLYDPSVEESFFHTFEYVKVCAENGVTLNPEKFKFCRKELDFCGIAIAHQMQQFLQSISKHPTLTTSKHGMAL